MPVPCNDFRVILKTTPASFLASFLHTLCSPGWIYGWILIVVIGNLVELGTRVGNFPNIDEVAHLPAGVSHWKFERFDLYRVNPPLVRTVATIPNYLMGTSFDWGMYESTVGVRPEFRIGVAKLNDVKIDYWKDFVFARLVSLVFMLLLGAILMTWVHQTLGTYALLCLSISLWFCPNLKALATTIVPDVGATAMGALAAYTFWLYLRNPTRERVVACGIGLGLALLSKLTWLTAMVSLPLSLGLCLLFLPGCRPKGSVAKTIAHMCAMLLIAIVVLNAGYLFEDTLVPLREYQFASHLLGGIDASAEAPSNRFKDHWLGYIRIPLPRNYVLGIDYLRMEVEKRYWSFLLGEWKFGSWPHYYVMTTLFKTPEPMLVGAILGTGVLLLGAYRRIVSTEILSMFMLLGIPALVSFASVSLQGGFNHHHRYVLMIYPPMFALVACLASPIGVRLLRFRFPGFGPKRIRVAIPCALLLTILGAASSLRVHPFYTSYFNTLSGGPANGSRLLSSSNIEWGQDILEVDRWIKAHPEQRPLVMRLDYFGLRGELFGVPSLDPPKLPKGASVDEVRKCLNEPQWWIINVRSLYNLPDRPGLEYLQGIEPVERIAYSYHVYRLDPMPGLGTNSAAQGVSEQHAGPK